MPDLARLEPRVDTRDLPGRPAGAALALWRLPLDDASSFDFGKLCNRVWLLKLRRTRS